MLKLMRIFGRSLQPYLREGDYVLASRVPLLLGRLKPGDAIIFHHPEYGTLVKQVASLEPDGRVRVLGLAEESIDSRTFGPISLRQVWGKVIWRLHRP
jgi:signal peptidase I